MKKLSLLFAAVLAFAMNAMALNPYAYAVSVAEAGDNATISYTLNAAATAVSVVAYKDGVELPAAVLTGCDATAGAHTAVVDLTTLTEAGTYTFGVKVEATSPEAPTKETTTYQFWSPYGIAIDKDPASPYFGRLLITEAQGNVPASYYTGIDKSGIYVFTPEFTPVMDGDKWACYKGGLNLTSKMGSSSTNAYSPIRIRISEDGRIFASMQDFTKAAVYEISQDLQTWTPVISGTDNGDGTLVDAEGNFVAGLNCSMDVKGSGENLKILLYSCNLAGTAFAQSGYRLDEYALGTATTFTGTPTHIAAFDGNYGLVSAHCAVYYDRAEEGAYWFTANRGGNSGEPNLVHFAADGTRDFYSESATYYGGAGLAQYDGKLYMGGNTGFIQAYTSVVEAGTRTVTASGNQITTGIGRNVNAIEFDYAGNMYACSNSGEKLAAFAMPYSGAVTTPVVNYEVEVEGAPADEADFVILNIPSQNLDSLNTLASSAGLVLFSNVGNPKGNSAGHWYFACDSSATTVHTGTFGVATLNGQKIDSIAYLVSSNNATETAAIISLGWTDASAIGKNIDFLHFDSQNSFTTGKGYDVAVWRTIDYSAANLEAVRVARNAGASAFTYNGAATAKTGLNKTFNIYGIKVWLHKSTTPDPEPEITWSDYILTAAMSQYDNVFKYSTPFPGTNVDVVQNPGWATAPGIYMTFPVALSSCSLGEGNYDIQGAGIILHCEAFTQQITEVTVTDVNAATYTFSIWKENAGTPTGFENIETEKAFKFYHNGQIFIQKGDAVYTITGVRVQ